VIKVVKVKLENRDGVVGKKCTGCSKWKPLDTGFQKDNTKLGGRRPKCKECMKSPNSNRGKKVVAKTIDGIQVNGKECSKCKRWKELSCYHRQSNGIGERASRCIECLGQKNKKVSDRKKRPPLNSNTKECNKCNKTLPLNMFYKDRKGVQGRMSRCKKCLGVKNLNFAKVEVTIKSVDGNRVEGKVCRGCHEWKPLETYFIQPLGIGARHSRCKTCCGVKGLRASPESWTNDRFDSLLGNGWIRQSDVTDALSKVVCECPEKHQVLIRPSDLYSGKSGCRKCANESLTVYTNGKIDEILSGNKNGWSRLGEAADHPRKVKVKCDAGHVFFANKYTLHELGCQQCFYENNKKWDEKEFDSSLQRYRKGWVRVGSVLSGSVPVEVLCKEGHLTKLYPWAIEKESNCKFCEDIQRRIWTNEYFDRYLLENSPEWRRCPESNIEKGLDRVDVICKNGHIENTVACEVRRKSPCSQCRDEKRATNEDLIRVRSIPGYPEWRRDVYTRDNFKCRCCGDDSGGNLQAHHLNGYHWNEAGRVDVDNGITLCEVCHNDFHSEFGYRLNTREQFFMWIDTKWMNEIGNRLSEANSETLRWLASANAMSVEEYRDYVYWCHDNPRNIDDLKGEHTASEPSK
jgi:hypothetical protein